MGSDLLALVRRWLGLSRDDPAVAAPRRAPAGPKPPELMTDSDWVRHRAPRRHRDDDVSKEAQVWLRRLPARIRPQLLCGRYPRVANRLARLWRDPGLSEHLLADLLLPQRPGRQGFPPEIRDELLALQAYLEEQIYETEPPDEA